MSRKFNAMLGLGALAAFGFASSAFAQCPSSPVPPWSSTSVLGGAVAIVSGGYDGTSCRMNSSLTVNGPGVSAFVRDDTPDSEPRYRAQFIVNLDNLSGLNTIQSARLFSANTGSAHLGRAEIVRLGVVGNITGTARLLNIQTVCEGAASNLCTANHTLPASGEVRIEIDWTAAASGGLKVWVNNTNEASPDVTLSGNSAGWTGVDFATLGLAAPSAGFRTSFLNTTVGFDEFDSRRSTFIGN